ncbi:FKBP-type peptidyl-prolyl cis-trans isomerase (chromatophore) [Paulinella micropora]|uniref:peptidylprolyl isomerase n=1 Tax=Paulinella micropora TaxID=1928728 RepID=A0A1L5YAY3_9EUKA|nr:FKBP-type peptidyl-prolyl cis-trans isomerase (PPIase) [Paulinella micropora]AQX44620.1 FKBP-type peptidyl-prolyl cis-trans isomerase [Paulinella micropora]BBL85827.1 FKBP-type peptidyl-prolyl cis-trans isomerase [Paulinella micropora]
MSEILISTGLFIFFLLVALISQLTKSSTSEENINSLYTIRKSSNPVNKVDNVLSSLTVDPDIPNPTLFIMAPTPVPNDTVTNRNAKQNTDSLSKNTVNATSVKGPNTIDQDNGKKDIYNDDSMNSTTDEQTTYSGLRIQDVVTGTGDEATIGQTISVNYRGILEDGTEFDKRYARNPFTFALGTGQVIRGWDEGLQGMRVGGKRILIIPPNLAYGSRGAGSSIPPDANLVYEVQLLDIT